MNIRSIFSGLLLLALSAMAADTRIDTAKSSIVATFKQMNVPVDAPFHSFGGYVDYDPAHPEAAKAELYVMTGSLDLGDEEYNAEVHKKDWFDSAAAPKATFVTTSIRPLAVGRFEATGTLTIKNKPQMLTVPVSVANVAGGRSAFDTMFEISRGYFGIGSAEWKDTVDDKVHVKVHLVQAAH
jgi:polyisoprenoid-binding protein YceI